MDENNNSATVTSAPSDFPGKSSAVVNPEPLSAAAPSPTSAANAASADEKFPEGAAHSMPAPAK